MKAKSTYSGTYRVRIGDINYGGHMGNDRALLLFHDARLHFLKQHGFEENDIGGPGLIMNEAHVYFMKEVFRGDELKVNIRIENLGDFSFVMHYTVVRDEEEVMHGGTKLIAFDYEKRRVTKLPDDFVEKITL